jgi:hypothetical protein
MQTTDTIDFQISRLQVSSWPHCLFAHHHCSQDHLMQTLSSTTNQLERTLQRFDERLSGIEQHYRTPTSAADQPRLPLLTKFVVNLHVTQDATRGTGQPQQVSATNPSIATHPASVPPVRAARAQPTHFALRSPVPGKLGHVQSSDPLFSPVPAVATRLAARPLKETSTLATVELKLASAATRRDASKMRKLRTIQLAKVKAASAAHRRAAMLQHNGTKVKLLQLKLATAANQRALSIEIKKITAINSAQSRGVPKSRPTAAQLEDKMLQADIRRSIQLERRQYTAASLADSSRFRLATAAQLHEDCCWAQATHSSKNAATTEDIQQGLHEARMQGPFDAALSRPLPNAALSRPLPDRHSKGLLATSIGVFEQLGLVLGDSLDRIVRTNSTTDDTQQKLARALSEITNTLNS